MENYGVQMEQPERIYRFRYASEKGTHGALSGKIKAQPPKMTWDIPSAYRDCEFMVLVSLYEENLNDDEPLKLSPHTLWEKSTKDMKTGEILYEPYFKPLERKEGNTGQLILKDCYISNVKQTNTVEALRQKYQKLNDAGLLTGKDANAEQQRDHEKENQKNNPGAPQSVRLGYTIFTTEKQYIYGPVLSEPITNADPVKINRICPASGSFDGGEGVVLLVNKISHPQSVEIRVFEVEENRTVRLEIIENKKLEFHGSQAIYTTMPKRESRLRDVECSVEIRSFGLRSESATYVYRNTNRKRRRSEPSIMEGAAIEEYPQSRQTADNSVPQQLLADCIVADGTRKVSSTNSEKKSRVAKMVGDIKKIAEKKSINNEEKLVEIRRRIRTLRFENGDTIFHAALHDGLFFNVYHFLKENFGILLRESRNDYNQNLLHYACEIDEYKHIRALIGLGCAIHDSDYSYNTPLHIAIERKHFECVRKFAEIIKNPSEYPEQFKADIKKLLSVYNQKGFTVLHMAVLSNLPGLVGAILIFCQNEGLDACTMRVLGNGDTIMHLAVDMKLKAMAELIVKHIPDAMYYRNYAIATTSDSYEELALLCDVSELEIESNVSK